MYRIETPAREGDRRQFSVADGKYSTGTDIGLSSAENGGNSAFAFYQVGEAREPQFHERDGTMRIVRE